MDRPLEQLATSTPPSGQATLPISETFASIQGEGKLAGVLSYFIRLSGCNLRCGWCDTPYASWSPDGGPRTIDDLVQSARDAGPAVRHAVLTGGEPLLFPGICELSSRLRAADLHVTIETAGTVIPEHPAFPLEFDLLSLSPKLASSTPRSDPRDPNGVWAARHEARRLNIPILNQFIALSRDRRAEFQLKFVVCGPSDLEEIESLLAQLTGWAPSDVLLMPEGVRPPSPEHRSLIATACQQRGFRYCPRLHIELFGNRRGT